MSDKTCGTCRWYGEEYLIECQKQSMSVNPDDTPEQHDCDHYQPYPPPETARYRADSAMLDWIEANCYVAIPGPKEVACDHQGGVEDKPLRPKIIAAMEKGASGDICGL